MGGEDRTLSHQPASGGDGPRRRRRIFWAVAGGAFLLAVAALFFYGEIAAGVRFLIQVQERKQRFRSWIGSFGPWASLLFLGLPVFQAGFFALTGQLKGFLGGR